MHHIVFTYVLLTIKRYLGPLYDDCSNEFRLERLNPGPFADMALPPLALPLPSELGLQDQTLLALFYRWALQTLSALHFIHCQSMVLIDFCSESIWLREDFSAAITGFIYTEVPTRLSYPYHSDNNLSITEHGKLLDPVPQEILENLPPPAFVDDYYDEDVYVDDCGEQYIIRVLSSLAQEELRSEAIEYEKPLEEGEYSHERPKKHDLFDWATFMWRLMSNHRSTDSPPGYIEPLDPIDPEERARVVQDHNYEKERRRQQAWQVLENRRLGHIFVKAWKGEYEDAMDIIRDVKAVVESMPGMTLVGDDEICIEGVEWDKVFTVSGEGRNKVVSFTS